MINKVPAPTEIIFFWRETYMDKKKNKIYQLMVSARETCMKSYRVMRWHVLHSKRKPRSECHKDVSHMKMSGKNISG